VTIATLTHDDVDDYAHAHIEYIIGTYAHLVDAGFARDRRAELAERIAELHDDVDACVGLPAIPDASAAPFRRHLIARNARGGVVGVAASGAGVGDWEPEVCSDAWVPPATDWTLDHLYTASVMHGSGLGQALLDAVLPGRHPAYLWVFTDNARALRFYERNGFAPDGLATNSGESWGAMPMVRLLRA
jgi:GNAT superfamily N-acetyltransferase